MGGYISSHLGGAACLADLYVLRQKEFMSFSTVTSTRFGLGASGLLLGHHASISISAGSALPHTWAPPDFIGVVNMTLSTKGKVVEIAP